MEWTNIRIFWPKLKVMKPYLPQRIFSQIERIFTKPSPTKNQLSKIATLGESIGLERNEIIAAVDAPLPSQGAMGLGRGVTFMRLILLTVIVVISILVVWTIVDPNFPPISTYTPGTDYGTIRPQDFSSDEITLLVT